MIWSLLASFFLATSCISTYAKVSSEPTSEPSHAAATAVYFAEETDADPVTDRSFSPSAVFHEDFDSTGSPQEFEDNLEVHGSIWFLFGRKYLEDEKFWSPIDEPTVGGFEVMYEFVKEFPFQIEFGFQYAKQEEEDTNVNLRENYTSYEIYLGLRQAWDINFFATHLYVGAGLAYYRVEAELQDGTGGTQSDSDQGVGAYLHTGFFVPLGTYLVTGIDLRGLLTEKLQLGNNTVSGNYMQVMVLAGFAW